VPGRLPFQPKLAPIAEVHQRLEQPGGIVPSQVLLLAIVTLVSMQQFAGLSIPFAGSAWEGSGTYPYQGGCFQEGSQRFTDVANLLRQAVPPNWQGAGADAYTTANDKLIKLAETMAALDDEMEKLVKTHAEVVSETQLGIGIEQDILIVALPFIFALEKYPPTFPAAWKAARVTATAAIVAAGIQLSRCLDDAGIRTKKAVDRLGYGDVLAAAKALVDPSATVSVPQSGESAAVVRAPSFDGVPASSAFSGTASTASSPGPASGAGAPLPWLAAPTGAGQGFGVDSTQLAAPPQQGPPLTPASVPGVAAVIPSGRAANRSAGLASPGNRINPQAWPAAPDQAARTDPGDDTAASAAAPGTTSFKVPAAYAALGRSAIPGAERAPIDLAAAGP